MGFYELGNGCDSCDTVSSILPNNINMQMDPGSNMVASMVMPYGTQNNMVKQYNGATAAGYGTQGSNLGMMGNGTTLGQGQPQQTMVMVPATTKTVTTANGSNMSVVVPAPNSTPVTPKTEGFANMGASLNNAMVDNSKMWIVLGLVVFSALAANECCKYFLNKSLQLNDGSPLYYVAYVVVAVLLSFAAYTYAVKN